MKNRCKNCGEESYKYNLCKSCFEIEIYDMKREKNHGANPELVYRLTSEKMDLVAERNILNKKLIEIENELRIARHKPAKQITVPQMLNKLNDFDKGYNKPIIVNEDGKIKKIIKVRKCDDHILINISSNLQIEYID